MGTLAITILGLLGAILFAAVVYGLWFCHNLVKDDVNDEANMTIGMD